MRFVSFADPNLGAGVNDTENYALHIIIAQPRGEPSAVSDARAREMAAAWVNEIQTLNASALPAIADALSVKIDEPPAPVEPSAVSDHRAQAMAAAVCTILNAADLMSRAYHGHGGDNPPPPASNLISQLAHAFRQYNETCVSTAEASNMGWNPAAAGDAPPVVGIAVSEGATPPPGPIAELIPQPGGTAVEVVGEAVRWVTPPDGAKPLTDFRDVPGFIVPAKSPAPSGWVSNRDGSAMMPPTPATQEYLAASACPPCTPKPTGETATGVPIPQPEHAAAPLMPVRGFVPYTIQPNQSAGSWEVQERGEPFLIVARGGLRGEAKRIAELAARLLNADYREQPYRVEPAELAWHSGSGDGRSHHRIEGWMLTGPGCTGEQWLRFGEDGRQELQRRADRLNVPPPDRREQP